MIKIEVDVNKNTRIEGELPGAFQAIQKNIFVAHKLESGCEIHEGANVTTGSKGDYLLQIGRNWVVYSEEEFGKRYFVGDDINVKVPVDDVEEAAIVEEEN